MGFYGNITNVNKTQFTFDKIYPNRRAMDLACATDGIFIGRFVLIEYDEDPTSDEKYPEAYRNHVEGNPGANTDEFYLYSSKNYEVNTRLRYGTASGYFTNGDIVQVLLPNDSGEYDGTNYTFYQCCGKQASTVYALFKQYETGSYDKNYNKDKEYYGAGKGYDSTVWQKSFIEGIEKYVNVAELNTVVPTFDLVADAPTMTPVTPHFDTKSTDVYYKLHTQATWGLRVAEAENAEASDTTVQRVISTYEPSTGSVDEISETVDGAIYFNKKAFNKDYKNGNEGGDNYITILPSGQSGALYHSHDAAGTMAPANDIQEFRINLPAIGNMMSDAWDIIHGPNRDNSPANSLQGRLNFFTKEIKTNEIPVQHEGGYLVGSTMVDDAWIYTNIDGVNKTITINHQFTEGEHNTDTYNVNGNGDIINLYVPNMDEKGHVVGENITTVTLPFGFKYITTNGNNDATTNPDVNTTKIEADNTQDTVNINTANKWIRIANTNNTMTIGHEVHTITSTTKEDSNLDGVGEFTVQDLEFDAAGHVTANQKHKYTLPYNIRNVAVTVSDAVSLGANKTGTTQADTYNDTLNLTTQNRWINLSVDEDNDTISIGHAAAGTTSASANLATGNNLTPKFGEKFKVLTAGIDQTGHIKDLSDYEITLPQPSLNDLTATEASVLTGISMEDSTGAITQTNANVGTLKLTGYTTVKANDATYVQASHTINDAFNKVDTRLDAEISRADAAEKALNKRIDDLDVSDNPNLNQVVYKVEQTDGKIAVTHENVGNLTLAGYALPESVTALALSAGNTLNTALGKLEYRLNTEVNRATAAEGNLSTAINNEASRASAQEALIRQEFAAADTTLTNNLNGEIERAKKAEETLTTNLSNEVKRAQDAEKVLTDNLSKEIERAQGAEQTLTNNLNTEIERAKAEEEKINGRIDDILGGVTKEELDTFKELSDALADDTNFASTINNSIAGVQTNLNNAIAQEVIDRNNAITEAINQEVSDRNGVITGAVEEIGKDISALDEKFADYLTIENAENTYQTKLAAGTDYVEPATLNNYLTTADASITYQTIIPEGTYVVPAALDDYVLKSVYDAKIAELTGLIEGLTARIITLEGYHTTTENPETGGEESVPEETT